MEIIINGQIAALKKGSSFDFIAENNLFTGSDSYTLAITFPLKDCPQNRQTVTSTTATSIARAPSPSRRFPRQR